MSLICSIFIWAPIQNKAAKINVLLVKLSQLITAEFRLNIAFIKIAATNMNINKGILGFACLFDCKNEIKSISGTNQSVLNNFTVVAVSRDSLLKDMAAPSTEPVSWMANAANNPKSWGDKSNNLPTDGNTITAKILNKNIIATAAKSSFGFDFITWETATIAVAPQIAVPDEIRKLSLASILNILANRRPMPKITRI